VRGLYDPTLSERGVLLCAARKPRAKDPLDFEVNSRFSAPNTQSCVNRTCMARLYALSVFAGSAPQKGVSQLSCLSHSSLALVYALLPSLIRHVLPVQQLEGP